MIRKSLLGFFFIHDGCHYRVSTAYYVRRPHANSPRCFWRRSRYRRQSRPDRRKVDDTAGEGIGQAHLLDATTGDLIRTFNDPTTTRYDYFGEEVAIDGNFVLIGAWSDDSATWPSSSDIGQAHLFDATNGNLLHTFDDPDPSFAVAGSDYPDFFGHALDVSGNNVLIGAPGHYDDRLGQIGEAYLFDATTGNLLRALKDPTVTADGRFGSAVAIDGNLAVVSSSWDNTFGEGVGQAYLYDVTNGTLLHTFNDPTVTDRDRFGVSVAIDGNNILIGATGDDTNGDGVGQVHLFDALTGSLLRTFNDPTITDRDRFGVSVAIDGNLVLIGAQYDDTNGDGIGQSYLFDTETGNLLYTFNDPTITGKDRFGTSVAIDGKQILIGAQGDDTLGENVGQAFLFSFSTGDFDTDGDTDGQDYLAWQRGESPEPLSESNLAAWQENFGAAGSLMSGLAVPEPTTGALAVLMLTCLATLTRSTFKKRGHKANDRN